MGRNHSWSFSPHLARHPWSMFVMLAIFLGLIPSSRRHVSTCVEALAIMMSKRYRVTQHAWRLTMQTVLTSKEQSHNQYPKWQSASHTVELLGWRGSWCSIVIEGRKECSVFHQFCNKDLLVNFYWKRAVYKNRRTCAFLRALITGECQWWYSLALIKSINVDVVDYQKVAMWKQCQCSGWNLLGENVMMNLEVALENERKSERCRGWVQVQEMTERSSLWKGNLFVKIPESIVKVCINPLQSHSFKFEYLQTFLCNSL